MGCQHLGLAATIFAFILANVGPALGNTAPQVTNVSAQQRPGTTLVDIYYDVFDADGDLMVITATCLDGVGGSVAVTSTQQGSDIGPGVVSGLAKHIVWDAGIDMPNHAGDAYVVEVTACDPVEEPDMVLVPSGTFVMGDGVAYCGLDEREVTLSRAFYLGHHEVTNQEYMQAVQWAYDNGHVTATTSSVRDNLDGSSAELLDLDDPNCEISFAGGVFSLRDAGHGVNPDHPVIEVTWYGAARYCDWLSMQADLPRAYQHSGDWSCNDGDPYGASGYRLPTDAEWEYAAQYNDDRAYPWGNETADCSRANYWPSDPGCVGWTSPVGSYPDAPASLELSDMAGNVLEWCNDRHACNLGIAAVTDPVGPTSGRFRVFRGGSWGRDDSHLLCAARHNYHYPDSSSNHCGIRVARTFNP